MGDSIRASLRGRCAMLNQHGQYTKADLQDGSTRTLTHTGETG
ncbi:MAG: hypothetical protein ABI644_03335 [Arenimonas sp.]